MMAFRPCSCWLLLSSSSLHAVLLLLWLLPTPTSAGMNGRNSNRHRHPPPGASPHPYPTARADDYRVRTSDLHGSYPAFADFDGTMHAGLVPTDNKNFDNDGGGDNDDGDNDNDGDDGGGGGALFFWLLEPTHPTVPDTLVIWLNGGPGCTSMVGLMFENGPVTTPHLVAGTKFGGAGSVVDADLVYNRYAWTNATAMLFVEQPEGTGFSYGREPNDEEELSSDFYGFLQNLLGLFGDRLRKKRLFIVGESYAGMYVPSIAHYIYRENKKLDDDEDEEFENKRINLAGIGLGNGWIDAQTQGPAVIDYAWYHGLIDVPTRNFLHDQASKCHPDSSREEEGLDIDPRLHPFTVPDECGIMPAVLQAGGKGLVSLTKDGWNDGPNTYDVTTWDSYPVLFSPNGTIARFFNDPVVREAINVPPLEDGYVWTECIPGEGRRRRLLSDHPLQRQRRIRRRRHRRRRLENDKEEVDGGGGKLLLDDDEPKSVVPYIADLLDDADIRVLVYNGDRDMSCCSAGSEACLNGMVWSGRDSWNDPTVSRRGLWMVNGDVAGYAKAHRNLEFVVVYNSGHMVPVNQPANALDLVTRFLRGRQFSDVELPIFAATGSKGEGTEPAAAAATQQDGEESEDGKGQSSQQQQQQQQQNHHHHVFALVITGVVAFILGMLSAYGVMVRRQKSWIDATSFESFGSGQSPGPTTETTPLHVSGRQVQSPPAV